VDSNAKGNWGIVGTESGSWKADLIKGRLVAEGIPVELRYEAIGKVYGITVDGLGRVEILVPEESVDRARELLSESFDVDDLPWEEKDEG
jgi:hypothetical protein